MLSYPVQTTHNFTYQTFGTLLPAKNTERFMLTYSDSLQLELVVKRFESGHFLVERREVG